MRLNVFMAENANKKDSYLTYVLTDNRFISFPGIIDRIKGDEHQTNEECHLVAGIGCVCVCQSLGKGRREREKERKKQELEVTCLDYPFQLFLPLSLKSLPAAPTKKSMPS